MRTNEEIKTIIEEAFKPLRCVARIHDYKQKMDFKVFDNSDNSVVEMLDLILGNHREDHSLKAVVLAVRDRVEEKGFSLSPWDLK